MSKETEILGEEAKGSTVSSDKWVEKGIKALQGGYDGRMLELSPKWRSLGFGNQEG